MKKTPLILIVDDHPLVRAGMEQMLISEGFAVTTAENGEAAVASARAQRKPDLVISDVRMPGMDGFATGARLRRFFPDIRVLLLAGMPLQLEVDRAKAEGFSGYLPKSTPWRDLVRDIRLAIGNPADFLCERLPVPEKGLLTRRETDVLTYLSQGKTREEIGIILGIGTETVKSHIKSLKVKLDVCTATGVIGKAYELGLLKA